MEDGPWEAIVAARRDDPECQRNKLALPCRGCVETIRLRQIHGKKGY